MAARGRQGLGDLEYLLGPAFGLIDPLHLFALGQGNGLGPLTRCPVDQRLFLALGTGNLGPFLTLGPHLLFHRLQNRSRRLKILDLIAQDLDPPVLCSLIQGINHLFIQRFPSLEGVVQGNLADSRTQGGLSQLGGGKVIVIDPVGRLSGIDHLQIQDTIHLHGHVVGGDTGLGRDVDGFFLQTALVGNPIEKGDQNMKSGPECGSVLAEPFDDVLISLRDNNRSFNQQDDNKGDKDTNPNKHFHQFSSSCAGQTFTSRSCCSTILTVVPVDIGCSASACQKEPPYLTRPWAGGRISSITIPVVAAGSTFTESSSCRENPKNTPRSQERRSSSVIRPATRKTVSCPESDRSKKYTIRAVHQAPRPKKKMINPGRASSITKKAIPTRNQSSVGDMAIPEKGSRTEGYPFHFQGLITYEDPLLIFTDTIA